jgi:hypothetical protein
MLEYCMEEIINFFNHPFFLIVGGITTIIAIVGFIYTMYLVIKGIFPVWYRLGMGLSKRKIAIFAEKEFNNLRDILVDSKIFEEKNIIQIYKESIKKAASISLLLVHWLCFENEIDKILEMKKDSDALIIYAPQDEGFIDKNILTKINLARNVVIVNFRGRLLNDILTSMMTTSYEKR